MIENDSRWAVLLTLRDVMKSARIQGLGMAVWDRDIEAIDWAIERLRSQAGNVEPVAWQVAGKMSAMTWRKEVADQWAAEGHPVQPLYTQSPPKNDHLRGALERIKEATLDGTICNDVAWFYGNETLHDYCERMLSREDERMVCPKCGAPDDALACDDLKCPGTAIPASAFSSTEQQP